MSNSRPNIQAVVFDVGGVLLSLDFPGMFNRLAARSEASKESIAALFHPERGPEGESSLTPLARATAGRITGKETLDEVFAAARFLGTKAELTEIYHSLLPGRIEETLVLFNALSKKFRLGILSNSNEWAWPKVEELLPELNLAENVIASFQARLVKPDPRFFKHVCDEFKLQPEEIIFIDDTPDIVERALGLGLRAIHFTSAEALQSQLAAILGMELTP